MKRSKTEICLGVLVCLFFLNSGDACALKKYGIGSYSFFKNDNPSKYFDIGRFGIKYNNQGQYNNQITISQFYQNGYDGSTTGWNVRSLGFLLHSKFNRFNFNVDQGILTDSTDNIAPTKLVHRFGLCVEQDYLDGDQMSFEFFCGTRKPFPELSCRGSYSLTIGRIIRFSGELYAMILDDKAYLFMATSFAKAYSNHYLTAKPYCLSSQNIKAGLILSDQVFFRNDVNYLIFKFVSGYYPDSYTFIDYERINNRRCRISCEGLVDISKCQIAFLPLVGCENIKKFNADYQTIWHFQLGLRYTFQNKERYARK